MSYCVRCGVELSEYNKECPLCNTKVLNTTEEVIAHNTDYPDYKINPRRETKRVNSLFVGKLLSMLLFNYAAITLVINLIINKIVSWSMIPVLSLALVWFGVAYPFLRKKNSFFTLFTLDSIAVIVYLLSLNYMITKNFAWSKYACLAIALLWIVMAGFFIGSKISKILPIAIYYILAATISFVVIVMFIDNQLSVTQLVLPITVLIFVLSIVSYFVIMARANDVLGFISVIIFDVSVLCLILDMIITHYYKGNMIPTWSVIVNVVTIPLFATIHTIKKGRELKSIISKKLHR